jgi:hypothetical protein
MTLITLQDGRIVLRDGKVGTEQACCCGCCTGVIWQRVHGECNNLPDDFVVLEVGPDCYSYYTWEDWDCQNGLRDCGEGDQCNIYARVKVTGNTPGNVEYLQSTDPDVWGATPPGGFCDCEDSFGSLEAVGCYGCCAWTALASGFPIDPVTCQCPEILGGGVTENVGGACQECPPTPYGPFRCLADAQAFAADYPEANWSYEPGGGICLELLDDEFCFPEEHLGTCQYDNPLP